MHRRSIGNVNHTVKSVGIPLGILLGISLGRWLGLSNNESVGRVCTSQNRRNITSSINRSLSLMHRGLCSSQNRSSITFWIVCTSLEIATAKSLGNTEWRCDCCVENDAEFILWGLNERKSDPDRPFLEMRKIAFFLVCTGPAKSLVQNDKTRVNGRKLESGFLDEVTYNCANVSEKVLIICHMQQQETLPA